MSRSDGVINRTLPGEAEQTFQLKHGGSMKKKTVQEQLIEYRASITERLECWKNINENGCSDPFWTDGTNMNLVRNHIIYYKVKIAELCEKNKLPLPEEYFLPLPPEADKSYMAMLNQKRRVEGLRQRGEILTTKKVKYDEAQLSLF